MHHGMQMARCSDCAMKDERRMKRCFHLASVFVRTTPSCPY